MNSNGEFYHGSLVIALYLPRVITALLEQYEIHEHFLEETGEGENSHHRNSGGAGHCDSLIQ